jgi:hypothetical protein
VAVEHYYMPTKKKVAVAGQRMMSNNHEPEQEVVL